MRSLDPATQVCPAPPVKTAAVLAPAVAISMIRIGKDDIGRLAAELEGELLQPRAPIVR